MSLLWLDILCAIRCTLAQRFPSRKSAVREPGQGAPGTHGVFTGLHGAETSDGRTGGGGCRKSSSNSRLSPSPEQRFHGTRISISRDGAVVFPGRGAPGDSKSAWLFAI